VPRTMKLGGTILMNATTTTTTAAKTAKTTNATTMTDDEEGDEEEGCDNQSFSMTTILNEYLLLCVADQLQKKRKLLRLHCVERKRIVRHRVADHVGKPPLSVSTSIGDSHNCDNCDNCGNCVSVIAVVEYSEAIDQHNSP
jgi:hypothetical protein